jgi:MoaA/NifB/PqqE/SkfB family radical SAM enzyme
LTLTSEPISRIDFARGNENYINVGWFLTDTCNHKCSYCGEMNREGTTRGPSKEKFFAAFDRLQKFADLQGKKLLLSLIGGEVTFIPDFLEFLKYAKSKQAAVLLTSNGSKPLAWWQEALNYISMLEVSYHYEFTKKDHYLKLAQMISEHPYCQGHLHVMMLPQHFDEIRDFAEQVKTQTQVTMNLQPLHAFEERKAGAQMFYFEYTDQQVKTMREFTGNYRAKNIGFSPGNVTAVFETGREQECSTYDILINGLNQFTGWDCFAGVDSLNIDLDGTIYGSRCHNDAPLGNVWDPQWVPTLKSATTCKQAWCVCGPDLFLRKQKAASASKRDLQNRALFKPSKAE